MTPWGRYKFLRTSMGLSCSGDEYNRRADVAFATVSNTVRVVDDLLCFDRTFLEHVMGVCEVLQAACDAGITFSKEKFRFARDRLLWVGYEIKHGGITIEEAKLKALSQFSRQTNISELRSFMGLVEQLAGFSTEVAAAKEPLRPLLSTRNSYVWTPDHDRAFAAVKLALTSPPVVVHFEPDHPSRRLAQERNGVRATAATRRRLASSGCQFPMVLRCRVTICLRGAGADCSRMSDPEVPLIPIRSTQLHPDDNPKIQRLKERLSPYSFTTVWRKGKEHAIPDALSRAPVNDPAPEDERVGADLNSSVRNVVIQSIAAICNSEDESAPPAHLSDALLADLRSTAAGDADYTALAAAVEPGFGTDRARMSNYIRQFWSIRHQLSTEDGLVLFGSRIVVPASSGQNDGPSRRYMAGNIERRHDARRTLLQVPGEAAEPVPGEAAEPVPGEAAEPVPGEAAEPVPGEAAEPVPGEAAEPVPGEAAEPVPGEAAEPVPGATDHGNLHVLVYADRLSGWPVVHQWRRDPTAREVVQAVVHKFVELGVPMRFRSDNGPQFDAGVFQETLKRWGVAWGNSTPHYPQSNGHAEAAVKAMKELVAKTGGDLSSEDFLAGLLEFLNTPHESGASPA
ncbi:uncharacterized protein LOC123470614 [Daphnia magna]|uniref:uncharacterized protein LOC123470614 n=1 Tax=Daphnia magna TaxID=35525 RepID=UPI001E1BC69F|nr:uncharacterized protein LOC123470614 [Daphnia magna]